MAATQPTPCAFCNQVTYRESGRCCPNCEAGYLRGHPPERIGPDQQSLMAELAALVSLALIRVGWDCAITGSLTDPDIRASRRSSRLNLEIRNTLPSGHHSRTAPRCPKTSHIAVVSHDRTIVHIRPTRATRALFLEHGGTERPIAYTLRIAEAPSGPQEPRTPPPADRGDVPTPEDRTTGTPGPFPAIPNGRPHPASA